MLTTRYPSPGDVLRELDRARTPESLDPIDSIGRPLSITVGRNAPGEGLAFHEQCVLENDDSVE